MINKWMSWFLLAWLMLAGSAAAQDKATIEALNARFSSAFNRGDFATVASMYTGDAYLLPPGADLVRGLVNIQAFWTKAGETLGDVELTTFDVMALDNMTGREIGTFSARTKGPQPLVVGGKYVVIWRKIHDDWRITTDIWNSNK
jgi:ketosteroid isomerase-like protein